MVSDKKVFNLKIELHSKQTANWNNVLKHFHIPDRNNSFKINFDQNIALKTALRKEKIGSTETRTDF